MNLTTRGAPGVVTVARAVPKCSAPILGACLNLVLSARITAAIEAEVTSGAILDGYVVETASHFYEYRRIAARAVPDSRVLTFHAKSDSAFTPEAA